MQTDKLERVKLYKDPNVQIFLSKFLSGEISELKPTFDPTFGYRYAEVEAILKDASKVESFLNTLFEAKVIERKLYDKILYCPSCDSQNVSTHYCCPYCKSFNIQKGSLVEHIKCGYMDVEVSFRKGEKLVCPKCHEELKKPEADYRKAGIWCTCKDCGKSFDTPITKHFCRECQADFTFDDVEIREVYAYTLNEEVKSEIAAGWIFAVPIKEFLVENGFEVETPAFLKGKSGAVHMFDVAAYRKKAAKKVMVMDVATATEDMVSEQPVIALFAKVYDVAPDSAFLIVIPKLGDNARKMADLYNIKVVEGRNAKEITKALKEKLVIRKRSP